ncbi:MAG: hypothetical protein HY320_09140 [Armatimonadetes bacterium]|nr:hypothetical protein [Armatimonadota bacterium]
MALREPFCVGVTLTLVPALAPAAAAQVHVVDGQHPPAADDNPGSAELSFKIISKAVQTK